jgi:sorting nexin-29
MWVPTGKIHNGIFNICQMLKKCKEVRIEMHHLFIDFKAAYDSVDRTRLYLAVAEMQIPKKLIILVRVTMRNM